MSETRFLARRSATGEWLDKDLQLEVDSRRHELSGSGGMSAKCRPDLGQLAASDGLLVLEPFATTLYVEESGILRAAGLVQGAGLGEDGAWEVDVAGVSSYPYGVPWVGDYSGIQVDPADVVRLIWQHLQSFPNAKALGMEVVGSTPVRIGTPLVEKEFTTGSGDQVAFESGPYELRWWDTPDCGKELDDLAKEAPFEWVERVAWLDRDAGTVRHWIDLRPQHGTRRTDLSFEQGTNVVGPIAPVFDDESYANEVVVLGAGEGAGSIRATAAVQDGRLRRPVVVEAKDVRSQARAQTRASDELSLRNAQGYEVDTILVRDHANAPMESWSLGDQVLVRATLPFLGDYDGWLRIVAYEKLSNGTAALELTRNGG